MANEITIKAYLSYAKLGQIVITRSNPTAAGDVLTQKSADFRYVSKVQNIGSAAEVIGLGDITSPGMCWMKNLGGTNTISIREGVAGAAVVFLEPGEWALFRMSGGTPYAICDVDDSDLEYFIIDD